MGKRLLVRVSHLLTKRSLWLPVFVIALIWWWNQTSRVDLQSTSAGPDTFPKGIFVPDITRGMQFFPASNPKIHVSH